MPQVQGRAQHAVVGKQKWHLDDHGQTTADRIYPFGLVQGGDLLIHILFARIAHAVLLVLFLDGLDLRLHLLHLERRFHAGNSQWQQGQIDDQSLDGNGPAPVMDNFFVSPFEPQKERPGDHSEETEVDQATQILRRANHSRDGYRFKNTQRLWSHVQARGRGAPEAAYGNPQDIYLDGFLGVGITPILGSFDWVSQSDGGDVLRIIGDKDGGKILVHDAGPIERARQSCATTDRRNRRATWGKRSPDSPWRRPRSRHALRTCDRSGKFCGPRHPDRRIRR